MCLTDPSNDQLVKDEGHKSFIAFDCRPSPLVLERIVKSLTDSTQDIRESDLSYDRKIGEVPIPVPRANDGPSSSKSTNEPIGRSPF